MTKLNFVFFFFLGQLKEREVIVHETWLQSTLQGLKFPIVEKI